MNSSSSLKVTLKGGREGGGEEGCQREKDGGLIKISDSNTNSNGPTFGFREFKPQGAEDGDTSRISQAKLSIDVRQKGISLSDGASDPPSRILPKQPRLPPLSLKVGMPPEKRVKGTDLVPTSEELCVRVAEKASHVSP